MTKILILDANQRSALAATRSLGSADNTFICCADTSTKSLAGSSRYCQQYHQSPSPKTAPQQFMAWLVALIDAEAITHLFPMTEITSQLLLLNREQLGDCILPFANLATVMSLANKAELTQLADKLDIPYPSTHHYKEASALAPNNISHYPIVLKPALSHIWLHSHWLSTSVKIINSANQLEQALTLPDFADHPFMQQAFIPGHGAGVFAIYNQGVAVAFFAHERLREKPPGGGVSVLSRSVTPNPQLLAMSKRLLDSVNWHGVAMVEYRIAEDGTPYLMEVNTRFWGSLQLAIDAGVDFPKLLLQIANNEAITPIENYTINQRLRWLLGDLDSLYIYLKDQRYTATQKIKRCFAFITPSANTRHEVNRFGDLGPTWFELKAYIKALRG
ncbi:ATP-grasp domain-containing protein [Dasania marina]|uniref:carboxylate--amine ligase n=1 Tax=Dasania marina TaxID=471499 RepID=UPI0030D71471|tara:strand:- start:85265 stop:86431 length:1167 start_codon:yes stop_codon:yes gene_type:complete